MRQRLLIGAVAAMTAFSWYAVYRTVRFTIAVATELDRATASPASPRAPRPRSSSIVTASRPLPSSSSSGSTSRSTRSRRTWCTRSSRSRIGASFAPRPRPDSHRRGGLAQRPRGTNRRGRQHHHAAARPSRAAVAARTFERKLREAMIALRLEERYSKAQILQAYLNTVYFGEGYYGVEAASRGYFGKPAAELGPGRGGAAGGARPRPVARCAVRLDRRARRASQPRAAADAGAGTHYRTPSCSAAVRGAAAGRLTHACSRCSLRAHGGSRGEYFQEEMRRQLVAMFGTERVLRGGLRVYSTYDPRSAACGRAGRRGRDRADRQGASPRPGSPGQSRGDRPASRRCARARRRPGLRRELLQPRDAGQAAGRLGVQADHLRRGARARLRAGNDARPTSTRRSDASGRTWLPVGEHEASAIHAAPGAEGVEQPRRGAAAAAGRRRHADLLRAAPRDRLGSAAASRRSRSAPAK